MCMPFWHLDIAASCGDLVRGMSLARKKGKIKLAAYENGPVLLRCSV